MNAESVFFFNLEFFFFFFLQIWHQGFVPNKETKKTQLESSKTDTGRRSYRRSKLAYRWSNVQVEDDPDDVSYGSQLRSQC